VKSYYFDINIKAPNGTESKVFALDKDGPLNSSNVEAVMKKIDDHVVKNLK